MIPQKLRENGEDWRQDWILSLDGEGRRETTASVSVTTLNDEEQARFDAEVELLLDAFVGGQLVRGERE